MSSRLDQIEAAMVDTEMAAMLKEKLLNIFSLMKPGMLLQYEPELDAVIEFLIWRFSIWVDKPTPGSALMNLQYQDERGAEIRGISVDGPGLTVTQKLWTYIATVGAQYIWVRSQSFFAFPRWGDLEQRSLRRYAWFCLQRVFGMYKAVSFCNLLIFLYTGKYRNLIERVLGVRLVYGSSDMNLSSNIDYLSDWNEVISHITSTNKINGLELESRLVTLLDGCEQYFPPLCDSVLESLIEVECDIQKLGGQTPDFAGKQTSCPICGSDPTTSFVALPCQHRYCYYCLQTRCSDAPSFRCVECSEPVTAMRRYIGSMDARTSTL